MYWAHGFELGVFGTCFREYGVPGFESAGYIVSKVLGYRVCSFSPPESTTVLSPVE